MSLLHFVFYSYMCIYLYRHTVLKVIFLNSQDIMSFQIMCWSDILQILHNSLTDNTLKKMTQDVLVRCSVIMCDHYMKLAAHFQNLVQQCPMTEYYFQHCLHISTYIVYINMYFNVNVKNGYHSALWNAFYIDVENGYFLSGQRKA